MEWSGRASAPNDAEAGAPFAMRQLTIRNDALGRQERHIHSVRAMSALPQ